MVKNNESRSASLKDLIAQRKKSTPPNPYITKEFQDYGYRLAERLGDLKHKALYIKIAKTYSREIIEKVYSFTIDYPNAKSKGKIFMWKLKQLKEAQEK